MVRRRKEVKHKNGANIDDLRMLRKCDVCFLCGFMWSTWSLFSQNYMYL